MEALRRLSRTAQAFARIARCLDGMRAWDNKEWGFSAAGVVLLVLTWYLTFDREGDKASSYAIGAGLGSVALGLALGALVRWLWIEYGDGIPPVTDAPYWLIVAGIVGVLLAGGRSLAAGDSDTESGSSVACTAPQPGPVGDGLTLSDPPAKLNRQLQALAAASAPTGSEAALAEMRHFLVTADDGRNLGVASITPIEGGLPEGSHSEYIVNANDGLVRQGVTPVALDIDGTTAIGAPVERGYLVVTADDCNGLQATAPTQGAARTIIQGLLGS